MDFLFVQTKIALRAIRANKVRAGLTVLGIVIGIASVITVFSAGEGINNLILKQIETFGTDIIEAEIKIPTGKKGAKAETQSAIGIAQGIQITTLTLDDMKDINDLPNITQSYAGILSQNQASYGNELRKVTIFGVSASFVEIDKTKIEKGRFFTDSEEKSLSEVIVLGSSIKDKLFGDSDPLGKAVKIHKSKYKVIGVMQERGAVFGADFDNYVYMPLITLQKKIMGVDHVLFTIHKLKDVSLAEETAEEARIILRENHDISDPTKDDFRVVTMIEAMDTLNTIIEAVTLLLLAIVIISLIVGGVGIMNIMYVAVSERTPEIGLRKAVGANYKSIMSQFLIESILITLM